MKVAVTCDLLVERTAAISVVESVLEIFEDAKVFSIVHHAGKILGPIEQRKIASTYMTNVITEERAFGDQWWKKAMLVPGACRNLFIPCSYDLIINISSGFSHGIKKCEKTKQITYLVENVFNQRKPKYIREKIFRGYLENWAQKKLNQADELWVLNEKEKTFWSKKHSNVSVMSPYFKATDFPLFPEAIRKSFPSDFLCFDAESLDQERAKRIVESSKAAGVKYKFVGNDDHLGSLKENDKDSFYGVRCSGELAPLLAASRGFVTFQKVGFPTKAVECLSTGTPVWMPPESEGHEYVSGEGVLRHEFGNGEGESIRNLYESMQNFDPKRVHAQVNQYHDLKFKAELKRRLSKIQ